MTRIISFLLSVVFAIDMFFVGLFPEKQLVITQTETETEYYINGGKSKIAAPEGDYKAFDMYGNEIRIGKKLTVSNSPIYVVY